MGIRDEFFLELREDFSRGPEDSFLYEYLKQEREARIGSGLGRGKKRRDAYVLLSLRFREIRGEGDEAGKKGYLCAALQELLRSNKLRPAPTVQERLEELGRSLGGPAVFRGLKTRKRRWEKLLELLTLHRPKIPMELVRLVHEELLRCCLLLDARTLLGDAARKKNPRKDRMLDLYFAFRDRSLSEQPSAPAPAGSVPGLPEEAELRELDAFFARVSTAPGRDYDTLLLPVCIDPATGAALCLLGRSYLSGVLPPGAAGLERGKKRKNCHWACFYVTDLNISRSVSNHLPQEEISVAWTSYDESVEEMLFPNLREAMTWYRNEILRRGKASAFFRGQNGAAPAECPARFRAYFENDEQRQ